MAPPEPRAGATAVTAVVLTRNEATMVGDCLASLAWAERRLVVDSGSRDATLHVARTAGADVVVLDFANYSMQRNAALNLVGTPWTLFVDADERVPPELAAEIRTAVGSGRASGYWIPRRNIFWGRALRGGGWWPDRQLRLLATDSARYDPLRAVHEVANVQGRTEELVTPLEHLNYASWSEFHAKQRDYAALEARRRRAEGWVLKPWSPLSLPMKEMWRRYVVLRGFKDGLLGLQLAAAMGYYEARAWAEGMRPSR